MGRKRFFLSKSGCAGRQESVFGTPCVGSGQYENSALAAEACRVPAFRVLTRIPCTSGGLRPVACALRP